MADKDILRQKIEEHFANGGDDAGADAIINSFKQNQTENIVEPVLEQEVPQSNPTGELTPEGRSLIGRAASIGVPALSAGIGGILGGPRGAAVGAGLGRAVTTVGENISSGKETTFLPKPEVSLSKMRPEYGPMGIVKGINLDPQGSVLGRAIEEAIFTYAGEGVAGQVSKKIAPLFGKAKNYMSRLLPKKGEDAAAMASVLDDVQRIIPKENLDDFNLDLAQRGKAIGVDEAITLRVLNRKPSIVLKPEYLDSSSILRQKNPYSLRQTTIDSVEKSGNRVFDDLRDRFKEEITPLFKKNTNQIDISKPIESYDRAMEELIDTEISPADQRRMLSFHKKDQEYQKTYNQVLRNYELKYANKYAENRGIEAANYYVFDEINKMDKITPSKLRSFKSDLGAIIQENPLGGEGIGSKNFKELDSFLNKKLEDTSWIYDIADKKEISKKLNEFASESEKYLNIPEPKFKIPEKKVITPPPEPSPVYTAGSRINEESLKTFKALQKDINKLKINSSPLEVHKFKQVVNDVAFKPEIAMNGTATKVLNKLREEVRTLLDDSIPGYKDITSKYSSLFDLEKEVGGNFDGDKVESLLTNYFKPDKQDFRNSVDNFISHNKDSLEAFNKALDEKAAKSFINTIKKNKSGWLTGAQTGAIPGALIGARAGGPAGAATGGGIGAILGGTATLFSGQSPAGFAKSLLKREASGTLRPKSRLFREGAGSNITGQLLNPKTYGL